MNHPQPLPLMRLAAVLLMATSLTACGNTFTRLSQLGEEPPVTPVQNPAERQPPVTMPMPAPVPLQQGANSLWRPGARAFLKDGRASQVGDILTVILDTSATKDAVSISNETKETRGNTDTANTTSLLGYESTIWGRLPGHNKSTVNPASLLNVNSARSIDGKGTIARTDTVTTALAAVVTQVLPNGNLVIQGSQEIRVNFETRVVMVGGVIRQADIKSDNTISHEKIAEARFVYGGRGQLMDVQQPRWGSQVLDILFPF
ncbi:MAG TPA: flagellar basal body L-ring protein FlgH [Alphaproteobacteria bacterium]